jgi:hypothetical protein
LVTIATKTLARRIRKQSVDGSGVELRRRLVDDAVLLDLPERAGAAEGLQVFGRGEGHRVEASELHRFHIRRFQSDQLDADVGFHAADIRGAHRAVQLDDQLRVGALELDQARHHPERPDALGHRNPHAAGELGETLARDAAHIVGGSLHAYRCIV